MLYNPKLYTVIDLNVLYIFLLTFKYEKYVLSLSFDIKIAYNKNYIDIDLISEG